MKKKKFIYKKLTEDILEKISKGIFRAGEKLPPVRKLSKDLGISINSVLLAYEKLQDIGAVESKPQSGFYIRNKVEKILPEIEVPSLETKIRNYTSDELVINVHELAGIPNLVALGPGVPSAEILPIKRLNKVLKSVTRSHEYAGVMYEFPPGYYKLRREISKRATSWGGDISPDDVIITTGGIEALSLALRAVANPGDIILTESPTFYLLLKLLNSLGMKILEAPTHPKFGIEVNSLKKIIKEHNIKACVLYPTINNPLGSIMPQENREKVFEIFAAKNIPIVEGDIWGEMSFNQTRPKPLKSMDEKGLILYFSSFSKTGAPGYRTGWICPGRFYKQVKDIKYMSSIATAALPQIVLAEYVRTGSYDKGINDLKNIYSSRLNMLYEFVSEYFPNGTRLAKPNGGVFLWVELPKPVDSLKLQEFALKKNISINPGPLFTTTNNFSNYIRLNCVCPWVNKEIEEAIKTLGSLCRQFL